MSLATRCVACGTIFRVVQDQLKVSEGWVRCGRCDEVFNALDALFDLEREAPAPWAPPVPGTPIDRPFEPPVDAMDGFAAESPPAFAPTEAPLDAGGPPFAADPSYAEPFFEAPAPVAPTASYFEPGSFEAPADHALHDEAAWPAPQDPEPVEAEATTPPVPVPFGAPTPAFVARANSAARWRQPGRLALLLGLSLLLVLMLGAQAAHHFRDDVAVRWPGTRGLLEGWCAMADCRLAAPRHIEDIVVESTGLTRAVAGTDTYRLAVTLHNRSDRPLALPYVDLTLTDNAGQLVARRALAPGDFERPATVLAARADQPLQALIATGNPKVSGYTVEIFYP